MPINRPSVWTIDGLTLNGPADENGVTWIATSDSQPLSAAAPTTTFTPKYQRHGSFMLPGFVERGTSVFTIRAYAQRDDWVALERARLKMLALCQDVTQLYSLVWYSAIGPLVQHVVREDDILISHVDAQHPAFEASVQFAAPDPRRYALETQVLTTGVPQNSVTGLDFGTGSGLDFGTNGGLTFGPAANSGTILLDNAEGTAPSSPVLTLTGPLTTPVLAVANGSIKYNGTLAAGQSVVITPEDPSVLAGTTSQSHLVNPANWDAFTVPPGGQLTIGLSHSGPSTDTGTVTAEFAPAFW
jgi:hypothetical protein